MNNPGPGDYDIYSKRPQSGAKIGNSRRDAFGSTFTPGPGAYDH